MQGSDDKRNQNELQNDGRNGIDECTCDERLEGEAAAGKSHQHNLSDSPDDASDHHGRDQAEVDALDVVLDTGVDQAADQTVGCHLKRHGKTHRVQRRHLEQQEAHRRQNQSHQSAVGSTADEAAQQDGKVHRADHIADFRDLTGQKGEHQSDCKEKTRQDQLFGVVFYNISSSK